MLYEIKIEAADGSWQPFGVHECDSGEIQKYLATLPEQRVYSAAVKTTVEVPRQVIVRRFLHRNPFLVGVFWGALGSGVMYSGLGLLLWYLLYGVK